MNKYIILFLFVSSNSYSMGAEQIAALGKEIIKIAKAMKVEKVTEAAIKAAPSSQMTYSVLGSAFTGLAFIGAGLVSLLSPVVAVAQMPSAQASAQAALAVTNAVPCDIISAVSGPATMTCTAIGMLAQAKNVCDQQNRKEFFERNLEKSRLRVALVKTLNEIDSSLIPSFEVSHNQLEELCHAEKVLYPNKNNLYFKNRAFNEIKKSFPFNSSSIL